MGSSKHVRGVRIAQSSEHDRRITFVLISEFYYSSKDATEEEREERGRKEGNELECRERRGKDSWTNGGGG